MPLSDAWEDRSRYFRSQVLGTWPDQKPPYPAQESAPDGLEAKCLIRNYKATRSLIWSALDEPAEIDPEQVLEAVRRMTDDQLRRLNQILDQGRRGSDFLFLPSRNGDFLEPLSMNARRK